MIEGDEEGSAKSSGDEVGELECPAKGADNGPEEDAILKLQACWKVTKRAVPKL